jgi:riboflavin synthase
MFTGLVADIGRIARVETTPALTRLHVESRFPASALQAGASVMHAGVCLTVVAFGAREGGSWWTVEAVPETMTRTGLGALVEGSGVNLELSLKLGDELGGHLVYGHVDGVGRIRSIAKEGESWRVRVELPAQLARYVAEKGSIAVDGISLTVAGVGRDAAGDWFEVAIIPHTFAVTTLGAAKAGDGVNLEVDMLARYVARMLEVRGG